MKRTVASIVVNNDLCVSCGACSLNCKSKAIDYQFKGGLFIPVVDEAKCIDCGACLQICPSYHVNIQAENRSELLLGKYICAQTMRAKDVQLCKESTSGGIVTQLIISLLKNNDYHKASVLYFPVFRGEKAKLTVTDDIDYIRKAAKSKYVPASVDDLLTYMEMHQEERIIITATPCQLIAIRSFIKRRKLSIENYLFIGLFCDMTMNYNFYSYLKHIHGDFEELVFRSKESNGWPGDMLLKKQEATVVVSRDERIKLKPYFQLNRCLYCFDKLNVHADISVGDCYEKGCSSEMGSSSVIIRTEKGKEAIEKIRDSFNISPSSMENIVESQLVFFKERNAVRAMKYSFLYRNIPQLMSGKVVDNGAICRRYGQVQDFLAIDNQFKIESNNSRLSRIHKLFYLLQRPFKKDTNTYIYIDHVGFVNKGAELMLRAIVEKVEQLYPDAIKVLPWDVYRMNVSYCWEHNILPLKNNPTGIRKKLDYLFTNRLRTKRTYILPSEITVILDAGGFQFADKWTTDDTDFLQNWIAYYKQFTNPVCKKIFLPQAFGPFTKPNAKQLIQYVYAIADKIYAREQTSYDYLQKVLPDMSKVTIKGDFTCLFHPHPLSILSFMEDKKYIAIIPNARMIDKTDKKISNSYMVFLCAIVRHLHKRGESVLLLNHEGLDDERLLWEINERLGLSLPILTNLNAVEIKLIIGKLKLLISSRFHGVVSGLSQGIPTLCTSWSHKYQELLADYKLSDNLLKVDNIEDSLYMIDCNLKDGFVDKKCIENNVLRTMNMWNDIKCFLSLY